MGKEHLHAVFGMAQTNISAHPFGNAGRTLRLVVESNVDCHALSVEFANPYDAAPVEIGAASIALCSAEGELLPDTVAPLTVGGILHFVLQPGGRTQSDVLRFALQPGEFFALSIYYPEQERLAGGNWVSHTALRSRAGNFSADIHLPGPRLVSRFARTVTLSDMTTAVTSVTQIIAHRDKPGRVLACFGDSITQQGNWTAPLTKLLNRAYPGQISLCNLGISGNRLLHDAAGVPQGLHGVAGLRRFEQDVLALPGLTHAILEIGTNDIGQPGTPGVPAEQLIEPEEYCAAMEGLADMLHQKGARAYAATLPPRALTAVYDESREALRHSMNDWIRKAECFDAVLDFDAILRRGDGQPGMKEGCALPDGLHPSPYGGLWLAKSIDLSLFGG